MGMDADRALLGKLGLDVQILDSGCCGMAGAFGFEAEHYEVSLAVAERVLLPAVRAAGPDALILADGFSCREQIGQLSGTEGRCTWRRWRGSGSFGLTRSVGPVWRGWM